MSMILKFSKKDKEIGKTIYRKFIDFKDNTKKAPIISFDNLYGILSKEERELVEKVISINPKDYRKYFTVFYGINPPPKNLIVIDDQKYFSVKDKEIKKVKTQFLPKPVFVAFKKMKEAMLRDVGDTVNVVSGYRSPAYQALVLFLILFESNWSLLRTLKRVTLPGCSEHGNISRQAVDVAPERGIRWLRNFDRTKEYSWLLKNAKSFGFEMSYPEGNKYGVIFEPWHWRYIKNNYLK